MVRISKFARRIFANEIVKIKDPILREILGYFNDAINTLTDKIEDINDQIDKIKDIDSKVNNFIKTQTAKSESEEYEKLISKRKSNSNVNI